MATPPLESRSQTPSPLASENDSTERRGADLEVAAAGLERLRGHRVRRRDASGIDGLVATIRRDANRNRTGVGSFVEAWEEEVPKALRTGSSIRSIRAGVARVEVPDAATKYELEQVLRGGLLARLRLRFGQPLRRVRVDIGRSNP
ncbi:MAG: DUF721 domain-containing protein [Phycisphaera sp.]|nr:DUF721 domain-containing protein [Phycisphaera sp.]